jgi:hypothetical protein
VVIFNDKNKLRARTHLWQPLEILLLGTYGGLLCALRAALRTLERTLQQARPGGITGHYLERDVHLGNRRIFRVLRETHFPWSVLKGKARFSTPFVEKRPAPPTPWSGRSNFVLFKKSSTPRQKSIFHRGFTVTPCRLKAARHTPNNPRYTRDEPGTDCCHLGARFTSLRFPRPPPTTTAHPHLPCLTWCMWKAVLLFL